MTVVDHVEKMLDQVGGPSSLGSGQCHIIISRRVARSRMIRRPEPPPGCFRRGSDMIRRITARLDPPVGDDGSDHREGSKHLRRNRAAMTESVQPSQRHEPCTWAEDRANGSLAFLAICSCGWRGPDRDDEIPADCDRWEHVAGCDPAPDGSWISPL
jgi:hypothetical protein